MPQLDTQAETQSNSASEQARADYSQRYEFDCITQSTSDTSAPRTYVFKIQSKTSQNSEILQIPQYRIFTQDQHLQKELLLHGFATSIHLTGHLISLLGRAKADELLVQYDLNNLDINSDTNQANKTKLLHQSFFRYNFISNLQKDLASIEHEEQELLLNSSNPDFIKLKYKLKLKLNSLIQDYIYKIKKHKLINPSMLPYLLDQARNIIHGYDFSASYNVTNLADLNNLRIGRTTPLEQTRHIQDWADEQSRLTACSIGHIKTIGAVNSTENHLPFYKISPNKTENIKSFEDVLKLYLTLNRFGLFSSIDIHQDEINRIQEKRNLYINEYIFNNILNFIYQHPWRVVIFSIFTILEIAFLPALAPILGALPVLGYLGFGNALILTSFGITSTLSIINVCADLPELIYSTVYKWGVSIYNNLFGSTEVNTNSAANTPTHSIGLGENSRLNFDIEHRTERTSQTALAETQHKANYDLYSKLNNVSKDPSIKQKKASIFKQKHSKNIFYKIPILSDILNYISEEYRRHSNWLFSYFQRNPILLFIYIACRCMSLLVASLMPFSNLVYCTFIDVDRVIDRHRTDQEHDKRSDRNEFETVLSEGHSDQNTDFHSYFTSLGALLWYYCNYFIQESLEALKQITFLVLFYTPVFLLKTVVQIILSTLYLALYLILNILIQPLELLRQFELDFDFIINKLLDFESMVTDFYYGIYFSHEYFMEILYDCIDILNSIYATDISVAPSAYSTPSTPSAAILYHSDKSSHRPLLPITTQPQSGARTNGRECLRQYFTARDTTIVTSPDDSMTKSTSSVKSTAI